MTNIMWCLHMWYRLYMWEWLSTLKHHNDLNIVLPDGDGWRNWESEKITLPKERGMWIATFSGYCMFLVHLFNYLMICWISGSASDVGASQLQSSSFAYCLCLIFLLCSVGGIATLTRAKQLLVINEWNNSLIYWKE